MLQSLMVDKSRGIEHQRKILYSDLRSALLQNYHERGNKSLVVMSDGDETIWGLQRVDDYFDGWPVAKITTDAARDFAQKLWTMAVPMERSTVRWPACAGC